MSGQRYAMTEPVRELSLGLVLVEQPKAVLVVRLNHMVSRLAHPSQNIFSSFASAAAAFSLECRNRSWVPLRTMPVLV